MSEKIKRVLGECISEKGSPVHLYKHNNKQIWRAVDFEKAEEHKETIRKFIESLPGIREKGTSHIVISSQIGEAYAKDLMAVGKHLNLVYIIPPEVAPHEKLRPFYPKIRLIR